MDHHKERCSECHGQRSRNVTEGKYECLFPEVCYQPAVCEAQLMREYDYVRKGGPSRVTDWGSFAPASLSDRSSE